MNFILNLSEDIDSILYSNFTCGFIIEETMNLKCFFISFMDINFKIITNIHCFVCSSP